MKNKLGITATAVLLALSLTACSNNNSSQSSSQSSKARSSQVQKKNSSSQSSAASSSSSDKDKKPSSQAPEHDRMAKLTAKLRDALPGMLLPTNDGLGTGSDHLNVRYTTEGNTNTVYYSVGNSAAEFNADSVQNEKPFAVLKEVKNGQDSDDLINYSPEQKGLPTVKLDSNTTATTQGAAGQKYVQWNQGNWSFVIQASSVLKQDPVKRAKEVLSLVNQYNVPQTSSKGNLHVVVGDSEGSLNTTIAWQNGKNIYQLKAHDTETALKMLSSLK
ncbi:MULTISPECIES: hypothetical protein [Lactobacillus]|uniref:Lipoprotein n=1 Tax=Lactobacillus xujianguonis TaxID=2495899 RepID=A0A437SUD1_9LACO|nr:MULTISPECIES: hypothetical protein [Lactobacillus]RVU70472.1 hypothetical protein EJK17_07200 [Lactobacillus xujianguonis]RVU76858.1 hypothetical protein EJK20_03505 [Lactobacillus xujianguonis]